MRIRVMNRLFLILPCCFFLGCLHNHKEKSIDEKIIGNWTSRPISDSNESEVFSSWTYSSDSSFYAFYGDYDTEGFYWIGEDSILTTVSGYVEFRGGDTSITKILEVNDSILKIRVLSNNYEYEVYRWE